MSCTSDDRQSHEFQTLLTVSKLISRNSNSFRSQIVRCQPVNVELPTDECILEIAGNAITTSAIWAVHLFVSLEKVCPTTALFTDRPIQCYYLYI